MPTHNSLYRFPKCSTICIFWNVDTFHDKDTWVGNSCSTHSIAALLTCDEYEHLVLFVEDSYEVEDVGMGQTLQQVHLERKDGRSRTILCICACVHMCMYVCVFLIVCMCVYS